MSECRLHDPSAPGAAAANVLTVLGALIYPASERKRADFGAAALAYGVRVCRRYGMPKPIWASDVLRAVKARDQRTQLQAAQRILVRRLQAGRALQLVLLSKGARSLTSVAKRSGGNRSHFMHAAWAQSLPVLHLSWAVLTTSALRQPEDCRPVLLSLIARAAWAHEAAVQSESKLQLLSRLAQAPEYVDVLRGYAAADKVRVLPHCADSPTG